MKISEVLIEALHEADEARIPTDLRSVAFSKAVDLLVGAPTPSAPSASSGSARPASTGAPQAGPPLEQIAARLNVDVDSIAHVFNDNSGEIEIIIGAGKLDKRSAAATKEIALLMAAGRQAAGIEDWTPVGIVREWCEHYKRLDGPNFASAIREMENVFSYRGSPRRRELRLSKPGWERAAELVRRLGSGGEA